LEKALRLTKSLQTLFPDNQFVTRCRFATLVSALEYNRRQELTSPSDLLSEGLQAAESLEGYKLADRLRPHFFDLVSETEKARDAWINAADYGSPLIVFDAIGFLYRTGSDADAWRIARACHPDTAEVQIARAYMLADSPEQREQAISLAVSAVEACPTWWMRQMASKVFLLLGDTEHARDICLKWMQSETFESDHACPWIWLDRQSVRYLAGEISREEYEQDDTTMWGEFYYHYTMGCEAIGAGNWEEARTQLQVCDERSSFISPEANWAKVFLNRLETDSAWPRGHRSRLQKK
jgi:hypothetical protein